MPKKKLVPTSDFVPDPGFVPDVPGGDFAPESVPWPGGKRNPFERSLGTDIPDLPQGEYDPRHAINAPRAFLEEAGSQVAGGVKALVNDPTTALSLAARRVGGWMGVPVGAAIGGGGEAIKQQLQRLRDAKRLREGYGPGGYHFEPEAPQTSEEAAKRIATATAIGGGFGAAAKGITALRARAAKKAEEKAAEAGKKVIQETLEKYRGGRISQLEGEIEKGKELAEDRALQTAKYKRKIASDVQEKKDKIIAQRGIVTRAVEEAAKAEQRGALESLAPKIKLSVESQIKSARIGKESTRRVFQEETKNAYTLFENQPRAQRPIIDPKRFSEAALELQESTLSPPKVLKEIIDLPPDVKLSPARAEKILSDLKDAARAAPGIGRTKAQGAAAKLTKALEPVIDQSLANYPQAAAHLKRGRSIARLTHELFERGGVEGAEKDVISNVGGVVSRAIRSGAAPESFAKKGVEHMQTYLAQTSGSAAKLSQRSLDSIVEKATPNGVFDKGKLAAEWVKYPPKVKEQLFSKRQIDTIDDLIKRDTSETLKSIKEGSAKELLEINRLGERIRGEATEQASAKVLALKRQLRSRAKELKLHKEGSAAYKESLAAAERQVAEKATKRARTIRRIGYGAVATGGAYGVYQGRGALNPAFRVIRALLNP
jgi:hypothetical protein